MANTKKIVKKEPQPIVKNKKLSLAAMILGYIAFALFVLAGTFALVALKMDKNGKDDTYIMIAIIIAVVSQVTAIGFAGVLLAKTKKHDGKSMKIADLVVGIAIIVAVAMLIISIAISYAGASSKALQYFMIISLAISEAALVVGCVFSTIDFVKTKKALAK